jgi:S1-C subfamily serine protease
LRGSLFVPLGGQYYLKVSDGTIPAPAQPPTPAPTPAPAATDTTNAAPSAPPEADTNAAPATPPPPSPATDADTTTPAPAEVSWHLQVVQLGASVSADESLTVYTPFFTVPDSAINPVAAPAVLPTPVLTDDEAKTIVIVKGDLGQGLGFFMRSPEGTFVVTQLHLLAGNPNVKLTTRDGAAITTTALKGSANHDLAVFTIVDNQFTYLPAPGDKPDSVRAGDQLIIPDVGAASDILAGKPGTVIGTNAERIDFDNKIGPGNTGAPVIHVKSGTAAGIVAAQKKVDLSLLLARAWQPNPAPGSANIIPYYAVRVGGVKNWETYNPDRFLQESSFLKQFHTNTRSLDSYLNGHKHGNGNNANGPPDDRFYLTNPKLRSAQDSYHALANGADEGQSLEGARELICALQAFAASDLATLQGMKNNLYTYNQGWAQEEIAYRLALKKELDDLSNRLPAMNIIARTR